MSNLLYDVISLISTGIKLQAGASDARSDDTSRLKMAVAEWINSRDNPVERLSSQGKEERGIGHDITGRLICPIDYDWDDPE
jgi:hypothetical protein